MKIIEFEEGNKTDCLAVFDSNLPKYFANEERVQFEEFLDFETRVNPYFVAYLGGIVVGCGGYEIKGHEACLSWGMVLSRYHNKNIGSALLQYRLEKIGQHECTEVVKIDTSQLAEGFFKKFGFEVTHKIVNGYGPGLHKIYMQFKL